MRTAIRTISWRNAAALLASMLMLAGCSTNPATGREQFLLLSSEQVAAMGDEAAPQLVQEYGGEIQSEQVKRYVNEIGQRVAEEVESEYRDIEWTFYTLDSEVINAFALSGGNVFITSGLLREMTNEAQLAGVLGHEIGHVTGRHVDERLSQAVAAELGLALLGEYTDEELITTGAALATNLTMLSWGRSQELESDEQGLKYMVRAGYDPEGLIELMRILEEAGGGGGTIEFFSTHPYPDRRIEEIRTWMGEHQDRLAGMNLVMNGERFLRETAQIRR